MAGYLPMQELVDLIRSGFRAGADILIVIEQGELYDRSDGGFVKCFETPGQMAEADDRVSPDDTVCMRSQAEAEALRGGGIVP